MRLGAGTAGGEGLIPVADRIRWLLVCRAGVFVVLLGMWYGTGGDRPVLTVPLVTGLGWLALTGASGFVGRRSRTVARALLSASLLGDGLLLSLAWWALGALDGPVGYLVILNGVAVTLLASFRTGTKVALWNSVLALLVQEATATGLLGPAVPVPMARFGGYLGAVWLTVLATASFAAMNERELRRRRYDSEVLRAFGLAVMTQHDPVRVVTRLARFAHDELQASRCAVVVRPRGTGAPEAEGIAGVTADDGRVTVHRLPRDATVQPTGPQATVLSRRLDPKRHPWLVEAMPGARNLIEVPFATDEASGVLVIEHPRRSSQRATQRVERRVVNTAEQATVHAAAAIGRALLTERIRVAAETDGLTGVANRRRFDATLDAELAHSTPLAVILVDLDHFKQLNDRLGHLVGDEVLRLVAQAITAACGERGLVARFGGEEFAVILSDADADAATALDVAEQIRKAVATAPTPTPVTASLGVASCPPYERHSAALLAAADAALYRAKGGGRDRVVVADDERRFAQPGVRAADLSR